MGSSLRFCERSPNVGTPARVGTFRYHLFSFMVLIGTGQASSCRRPLRSRGGGHGAVTPRRGRSAHAPANDALFRPPDLSDNRNRTSIGMEARHRGMNMSE